MSVLFECVSFNEEGVRHCTKEVFIENNVRVLWQDRSEEDRRKMLADAYEIITKGAGQK